MPDPVEPVDFSVLGYSGLKQFSGNIYEEFLPELQGQRAVKVYKEMRDNSFVIGAIMYTINNLARNVKWSIKPPKGFENNKDAKENALFIKSCFEDMSHTHDDLNSEILSMLPFGWSYFEKVYKIRLGDNEDPSKRSKFNDGRIGWRKIAIRSQETLDRWEFDDDGGIKGMWQNGPPTYKHVFIPIEKALLFRTGIHKGSPEGRALTLDTPVPTPDGWTTMGEIKIGDKLFDETGKIRYVIEKSEVFDNRDIYRITFSDGSEIEADENHQWLIKTFNDRYLTKKGRISTTKEMYDHINSIKTNPQYTCEETPVLDCPELELPCDPYLLGYWLGDGARAKATISVHANDYEHLSIELLRCGYRSHHDGATNCYIKDNFVLALRSAGVYEKKYIPSRYLRASKKQRMELLRGLMDSDGYCPRGNSHDKASLFSNTNTELLSGVMELIRTLGGKPRLRCYMKAGRKGGIINGKQITARKDCYSVRFKTKECCYKLPRKVENFADYSLDTPYKHYIESIEIVRKDRTVCIQVDSPSSMFLCGEGMIPTHNSLLRNAVVDHFYLKRISEAEAIGISRDMGGLPTMQVPPAYLSPSATPQQKSARMELEKMLSSIHRDQREFAMVPSEIDPDGRPTGFKFSLLGSSAKRQINTNDVILRYGKQIAMSMLAEFIYLGLDKVGSFALANTKTNMFSLAIGAILDSMSSVFERFAFPDILKLNGMDPSLSPRLVHGDLIMPTLEQMATYVNKLAQADVLTPSKELENMLLDFANLPRSQESSNTASPSDETE